MSLEEYNCHPLSFRMSVDAGYHCLWVRVASARRILMRDTND